MKNIKSFGEFQKALLADAGLQQDFKTDPVKAVLQFQAEIPDTRVYRLVVGFLGLCILFVIVGTVVLALSAKIAIYPPLITLFTAIASGAIGALAGLLTPSPKQ